ncbi:cation diffusion facilitator family transporter [Lysinibacillus pakistanensis]|uniref:cation diffusion facilitator family transporter n=1 Tax=Lysinibacillus pakistanensis TaxID=759811 RepID=UPI003D2CCD84
MSCFFGALVNIFVSRIVYRTAKNTNSVAMKSNALHLLTDVYTSLGVALSLLIVHLIGWYILDPIIGIVLAFYIMMEEAFPPLLDASLSKEEEEEIKLIIESFKDEYIEYHDFRTRSSGAEEYIDFH